jgi:rhodanese-related sulfurtransferase
MPKPISRKELEARIEAHAAVVIEALTVADYEAGHIPGAVHLAMDEVEAKASALIPDKQTPVVTYCANTTCQNSARVAEALERLGYERVYEYVEGKADWKAAGLPLESIERRRAA